MGTGYGRMTDEIPSAEIIQGPWKKGRKVVIPDNNADKILEDITFANELNDQCMIQYIHTLQENGVGIEEESFLRDMSFIIEVSKATIYKSMGMKHPLNILMDGLTESNDSPAGADVDFETLGKLYNMIEDEQNDPDPKVS